MLSMQMELIGCLLLKFWLTLGSVVSTPQLCTLAEWYSLAMRSFRIFGKWSVPSKQANIHMHVRNEVMLVWGSLRLAPISMKNLQN